MRKRCFSYCFIWQEIKHQLILAPLKRCTPSHLLCPCIPYLVLFHRPMRLIQCHIYCEMLPTIQLQRSQLGHTTYSPHSSNITPTQFYVKIKIFGRERIGYHWCCVSFVFEFHSYVGTNRRMTQKTGSIHFHQKHSVNRTRTLSGHSSVPAENAGSTFYPGKEASESVYCTRWSA